MLDAETQRRELSGVAPCPSRITPTRCQFLSNPLSFNLLNRFCVTRTQFCFRQVDGDSIDSSISLFVSICIH